jgi:hypothetical protein
MEGRRQSEPGKGETGKRTDESLRCCCGNLLARVLSGWLLYYIASDAVRDWSSVAHWATGLCVLPLLCAHIQLGRSGSAALGRTGDLAARVPRENAWRQSGSNRNRNTRA